jgi:hypothetical protein
VPLLTKEEKTYYRDYPYINSLVNNIQIKYYDYKAKSSVLLKTYGLSTLESVLENVYEDEMKSVRTETSKIYPDQTFEFILLPTDCYTCS